jgi:hypothetical protein
VSSEERYLFLDTREPGTAGNFPVFFILFSLFFFSFKCVCEARKSLKRFNLLRDSPKRMEDYKLRWRHPEGF